MKILESADSYVRASNQLDYIKDAVLDAEKLINSDAKCNVALLEAIDDLYKQADTLIDALQQCEEANKHNFYSDTFNYNGTKYCISFEGDKKVLIGAYDPTHQKDQHEAVSNDCGETFAIYKKGKFVEQLNVVSFSTDEESGISDFNWREVAKELYRLDNE